MTHKPDRQNRVVDWGLGVFAIYPDNFCAEQTLPSLAIVDEPDEADVVPAPSPIEVHFSEGSGWAAAEIPVASDVDVYGGGEVTGPLRRNGTSIDLWNTDNLGYRLFDGRRLYQAHPFMMVVQPDGTSLGVIADTTWRTEIRVGKSIRFESQGPSFRILVFEGSEPAEVVKRLGDLTGRMQLPPLWALGYHQSRWSYYPANRVRTIADTFRQKAIPLDALWLDIHYMDDYRVFTFDKDRFPDPENLTSYLRDRDIKSVWMIDPGIKAEEGYTIFDTGAANAVWVKDEDGATSSATAWPGRVVFPDFTAPQANEWWEGLHKDFLSFKPDGLWNDMNEPADLSLPGGTLAETCRHQGGVPTPSGELLPSGPHVRYHNVYGMLMARSSQQALQAQYPDRRPFLLTRANYLGGQRYAATWTGDNQSTDEHMRMSIPMSLTLGLSGQPFSGPDLGGFDGDATAELFGQWMSVGVFFPFCRGHTIEKSADHEPWSFGDEVEDIARCALERRYALLPSLYTLFEEAARSGLPVMRPVFWSAPDDVRLRAVDDRFLLGSDLLVEPSWCAKTVSFGEDWLPLSLNGEPASGGSIHPTLRVRPGSIVPSCAPACSTASLSLRTLTLNVAPSPSGVAKGSLYWDEGEGFGYRSGTLIRLYFELRRDGSTWTLTATHKGDWDPGIENVRVRILGAAADEPFHVALSALLDEGARWPAKTLHVP